MAGKHAHPGITLGLKPATLPPIYPGTREDRAYAEGRAQALLKATGGENPHLWATPEYIAWANGNEVDDSEQTGQLTAFTKYTFADDTIILFDGGADYVPDEEIETVIEYQLSMNTAGATNRIFSQTGSNGLSISFATANDRHLAVLFGGTQIVSSIQTALHLVEARYAAYWTDPAQNARIEMLGIADVAGDCGPTARVDPLRIGETTTGGAGFIGTIRDVKVWLGNDRTAKPTHHWKINEGTGTTIIDRGTATAVAGTLTAGAGSW